MTARRSTPRRIPRAAIAWGVSIFLLLSGATAANAAWNTATSTISPGAASGTVDGTIGGNHPGSVVWTKTSHSTTVPSTLNNTGTLDADWSYSLASSSPAVAASTFTSWVLNAGEPCDATSTPHDAVTATGSMPPALTGHFAKGATVNVCTRASISDAGQATFGGKTLDIAVALTTSVGSWTGGQSFTIPVSITDDSGPTQPVVTPDRVSGYSTRVNWTASTDNVGVTGYRVYRNGAQVAQVAAGSTSWTDATLSNSTTYTWAVEAFDAAGNVKRSTDVQARTLALVSNANYTLFYPYGNKCIDAAGGGSSVGTNLIIWDCHGGPNQTWTLRPVGDGSYQLESANSTNTAIGSASNDMGRQLQLSTKATPSTHWLVTADGNGFRLVNDANQMCMDVAGVGTASGTALTQWTCIGNAAQFYQLQRK